MNLALEGGAWRKINRWAPVLVKGLAVVWGAWALAGLAWLASGHDRSPLPAMPARAEVRTQPRVDTSRLASLDLFGKAQAAAAGQAANAPDTTLQLKLNGVFVSGDADRSSAIVSESSQPNGKLYRVNDSLPGGATLAAVYPDRILLKRGEGSTEVLRFEKTSLLGGEPKPPAPPTAMPEGSNNVRGFLDHAAVALEQQPEAFLNEMGLIRSGRGYEIGPNAPEKITKSVGLRPGDRIVSVNGQPLGNLPNDRALLQQVKERGSARIEIQRGSQTLTIDQKF